MKNKQGLVQALGILGYVVVFSAIMKNGSTLFPHINEAFAPVMFLSLFCFSVLTCGLIVFYRPYMLFVDKKGKEAMQLVLSTTQWLGLFVVLIVGIVAALSR